METITARRDNGLTKVDMEDYYDDVEIESLYSWIDRIPLSRPKKNMAKDFADAILCAEVVKHYFPRMVDLHNYAPASGTRQRKSNWEVLNKKVLVPLGLQLSEDVINALANNKPKVIERVLMLLRMQIDALLEKTGRDSLWRRRQLYHMDPDPVLRLHLNTPPSHPNTPPAVKSPRGENTNRSISPNRLIKSEPTASPRKYNKGEIPHGHPDRTRDNKWERNSDNRRSMDVQSYFADKPPIFPPPKPFLPPVSDNVPRVLYEEKDMECQAKEETIQILHAKIRRLEHLLHLKNIRLDDLHHTLQQGYTLGYAKSKR